MSPKEHPRAPRDSYQWQAYTAGAAELLDKAIARAVEDTDLPPHVMPMLLLLRASTDQITDTET